MGGWVGGWVGRWEEKRELPYKPTFVHGVEQGLGY